MVQLDYLEWDSLFFEKRIFRTSLSNYNQLKIVRRELDKKDVELCYVFSDVKLNIENKKSFFNTFKLYFFHAQ